MKSLALGLYVLAAVPLWPQQKPPASMTRMVVRLMGPDIQAGSPAALPKTIYRAGDRFARIEDPPDAKLKIQKLTVVNGPDAYSINLIDKTGRHASEAGSGRHDLHLPIVLPLDPKHRLGKLDGIEFGAEVEFFEAGGAMKQVGPLINAKPTDEYVLKTPAGDAHLIEREQTRAPVFLSWPTPQGVYKYEYISYEDVPFRAALFGKPQGVRWKEIPADPDAGAPGS